MTNAENKSLEEWLNEQGRPTPEESAQHKAAIEASYGTMSEWAQMQEDGSIGVYTSGYAQDGGHGTGGFVVLPDDERYEEAKQYYGLGKPGDTYHKQEKWVDGQWVTVLEERPDQKSDTDKAKSA